MTITQIYKGVITAIITPQKDGQIDLDAFNMLLDRQIAANTDGIVVAGSTGEGVCLSPKEIDQLLSCACAAVKGTNIPIIGGISTASTAEALDKIDAMQKHDIDGLMLTVPYYIKPSKKGVIEHYRTLHDNSNLPILVYNHPDRTGTSLDDDTIAELSRMERIMALKDASGNIQRPSVLETSAGLKNDFSFLTGNDDEVLSYMASAGNGVVSVLSNIMPKAMKRLVEYLNNNQTEKAAKLNKEVMKVSEKIFALPNPIGVKCAHMHMGHCHGEMRMPLMPAEGRASDDIRSIVEVINDLEER